MVHTDGGSVDVVPIILGCVSAKRDRPSAARDLYTSPLFARRRRYADASGRPWFVFSALHGIVDQDTVIAPYDVSLKDASPAERRRMGEVAARGLEERLGDLAGRTFEIHAGAAYVEGLRPALARRRANLTVPLQGLRIGEQLHWYDVHQGAPSAREPEAATSPPAAPKAEALVHNATEEIAILATTPIGPFTFRWPADLESFEHGWDMAVRARGTTHRVRLGIGLRVAYGRPRVRAVTWVAGQPMVEGVGADDYSETRGLLSLLRRVGGSLVRSSDEIPAGYAGCRIVDHAAEIAAPYSRHGLAIKLAEDDLVGWARHALLRMWAKAGAGSTLTAAPPQPALVPSAAAKPGALASADRLAVAAALLGFGAMNPTLGAAAEPAFTYNPEANALLLTDPFAFLLAVIFDEGVVAERAWEAPYVLRARLGYLDPVRLAANPEAVAAAVQTPPKLHRFVNKTPVRLVAAAHRVLTDYAGDAGRIWGDDPTAKELQRRLQAFAGIGQKKAAMAVAILARDLGVAIRAMEGNDVAYDVHIRRVFLRTGIAERDDPKHLIAVARELHPEQPSALDLPAWLIGRSWCRPEAPRCAECPIEASCPRLLQRAAGVAGI